MPITFEQIMECHPENRDTFRSLVNNMRFIVPFIGAGLSIPPYQTWRDTLLTIANQEGSTIFTGEILTLLDKGMYEEAASALLKRRGQARFDNDFIKKFSQTKLTGIKLSEAMELLPSLFS